MKRQRINPIKEIECKWCNKMIPSTNLSNHIKFHHKDKGTIDDYVLEFGEFRANKIKKEPKRIIPKSTCEICAENAKANLEFYDEGGQMIVNLLLSEIQLQTQHFRRNFKIK